MGIIPILSLILVCFILIIIVHKHKQYKLEEVQRVQIEKKVKDLQHNLPKKMKKVIKKDQTNSQKGVMMMLSKITNGEQSKMIEAFEDIKDIRYGKIGASNHNGGDTINRWIKISNFTVSGAWDARGFTLEVYPRIRYHTSGRQTLVCLVRNSSGDIEAPYVSLTTHNESEPNTRLIKDVRVIRTSGSGITNNNMEVWIQFGQSWADTAYVMYYLYNFKTKDFIATVPQAQVDNPPSGQAWGINDKVDPRFIETSAGWVEKIVKNNANNAYTLQGLWNNAGVRAHLFLNSNDRQADGGPNTATLRNDNGDLRLQAGNNQGIHVKADGTNVVMGDLTVTGKITIGKNVLKSEGNSLYIDHVDGRRIMRIDPDGDKLQIYKNSDGKPPYFYYNAGNDFYTWPEGNPNMRHGDTFTIRQPGGNRLMTHYGWGQTAQFNNTNRQAWEIQIMEKCGYAGIGDGKQCGQ
jgi:hypothetical protein